MHAVHKEFFKGLRKSVPRRGFSTLVSSYEWLLVINKLLLSMVINGYQEAINGYQWLSKVINDYQ